MKMDEKEKYSERNQERKDSTKLKLTISILSFLIVFVTEVYVIINAPRDVQTILLATVMLLIAAYFVVDSVMALGEQRTERLAEQYEDICNTQKAAYIVLNNSFEEMGEKLTFIEKILKISTDEVINAQKGTSKVIINRNKENTEAILQSYVELTEKLETIEEVQKEKLSVLDVLPEKMIADLNKQIEWNIQQLAIQMKDMELHLNQSIMQNSKVVVSQAVPISMPENMNVKSATNMQNVEKEDNHAEFLQARTSGRDITESSVKMESVANVEECNVKEILQDVEVESAQNKWMEEKDRSEQISDIEGIPELETFNDDVVFSELDHFNEIKEVEESEDFSEVDTDIEEVLEVSREKNIVEAEREVAPELRLEEPMLEIDEYESMHELMVEEPLMDDSIAEDITVTEVSVEGVGEGKPIMPDLSNPNKIMTPEEIEALIANTESIPEEPMVEEVKEEKPAMPDLSNPNKIMTPEEIAALIANTESIPEEPTVEEVKEEKPAMPDLSDPNKMMTPDEIAALIASVEDTPEESKVEEKPAMPDLSDPNKVMTPEEIAALIANL